MQRNKVGIVDGKIVLRLRICNRFDSRYQYDGTSH